jgi:hypothetical protein
MAWGVTRGASSRIWRGRPHSPRRPEANDDHREQPSMCRNIRTLYHFDPPVTDDENRAASLRFVRNVSDFTKPSAANQVPFDRAVADVAATVRDPSASRR